MVMKIGFIGGDLRQLTLLGCFKSQCHDVKIFGYDGCPDSVETLDEIKDSDVLIFPLPSCSGEYIFAPMTDKKIHINDLDLKGCKLIFYAGGNELLNKKLIGSGSLCINYIKNEELAQKNAIATAEGTLEIVINETAETVFGSRVLVTGFGKVSKAVAKIFSALGAEVTVAARRREALAEAYCENYKTCLISDMADVAGEYDVIINTVPAVVIDKTVLGSVRDDALIIDLASKPGGVDFESAKKLNRRVIWALSLPGKVAPVTSGKIIFETLSSIMEERAVTSDES